jgi:flagellar biogenesis protein FliO
MNYTWAMPVLIPAAMWAWVAVLRRWRGKLFGRRQAGAGPAALESVARMAVAPQHSLHLVRVGERALLLSVSATGCRVLDRFTAAELAAPRREVL